MVASNASGNNSSNGRGRVGNMTMIESTNCHSFLSNCPSVPDFHSLFKAETPFLYAFHFAGEKFVEVENSSIIFASVFVFSRCLKYDVPFSCSTLKN